MQKRVKRHPCNVDRKSNVPRYEQYLQECYENYYDPHDEEKSDILNFDNVKSKKTAGKSWTFMKFDDTSYQSHWRFTGSSEYYAGRLGNYLPNEGYF